jgi:hypothetical protein
VKWASMLLVILPAFYFLSCSYVSNRTDRLFESITTDDTIESVIRKMGTPSIRETSRAPFLRYATKSCEDPCVERLWYENRMTFDMEAWSIEIDRTGKVLKKARWISS